jgi:hypothetical protein
MIDNEEYTKMEIRNISLTMLLSLFVDFSKKIQQDLDPKDFIK